MVTEMINIKLDNLFLQDVDRIVKKEGYQSRTEFIRNALREKIEEHKLKAAMIELSHLRGASKKNTSDEDLERIREKAFEEIFRKLK